MPSDDYGQDDQFFDELRALCEEYNVSIRANAESYYPSFQMMINKYSIYDLKVNYLGDNTVQYDNAAGYEFDFGKEPI